MSDSLEDAGNEDNPHSDLPDYAISAEKVGCKVSIDFNGVAIAESDNALLYRESRLTPVYYFPREDVRMDLLRRTRHRSHCPFKGNASYWSVNVGDREVENAESYAQCRLFNRLVGQSGSDRVDKGEPIGGRARALRNEKLCCVTACVPQ